MAVAIVTDSLSDLTTELTKDTGIVVVPLTVIFGHETYLDRVTITTDEFYRRLVHGDVWPASSQPTPKDFAETYEKLAENTDEILTLTLSSKLSGTYQSAVAAKGLMKRSKCRVEVIDSQTVAMGLGLVVLSAAQQAKKGLNLNQMVEYANKALARSHFMAYFDTLKYLAKGGRIGKARSLLGSVLSIKPILNTKDGEMSPVTRVRSQAAGMDYLFNFITGFKDIEMIGLEHTTQIEPCNALASRVNVVYPKVPVIRSTVSPVLGVHGGPNALAVTVLERAGK